jgi:hypothetical protein
MFVDVVFFPGRTEQLRWWILQATPTEEEKTEKFLARRLPRE